MRFMLRSVKSYPLLLLPIVLVAALAIAYLLAGSNAVSDDATMASPPDTRPVLQVYTCPPDEIQRRLAQWEAQFADRADVRLVHDAQRSQILMVAPPAVHAALGRQMNLAPVVAEPASVAQAAASPPQAGPAGVRQAVQLWHAPAETIEASLMRTWRERLTPLGSPRPGATGYEVGLAHGQRLRLLIDPRAARVELEGTAAAVEAAGQLVHALDHPPQAAGREIGVVALHRAGAEVVRPVLVAFQENQPAPQPAVAPAPPTQPATPPVAQPGEEPTATQVLPIPGAPAEAAPADGQGMVGPVQIEILEGLDVLVIRGHPRDVRRVAEIINQIETLSQETKPTIEILRLAHVDAVAMSTLLQQVHADVFATRVGSLSITALGKPNSLLLIGREEPVRTAVELARRLDQPVPPASQFQVFRLKQLPAEQALESVEAFFAEQQQGGTEAGVFAPRVQVVADFRSNALVVRGSPRELAEVGAMLQRMDGGGNAALNQVRVFKLRNSLAETLAPVLQDAITGQIYGQRSQRGAAVAQVGGQREQFERKSTRLQFLAIDTAGQRTLNSGILTDAQVTPDPRTNALVVTASAESMPLIAALIQELDQPPEIEAQVKVFTLINSDASGMVEMLQGIFGQTGNLEGVAVRTGTAIEQSSLVGLRFAVDARTNSIIATGSAAALTVVEAVLLRLDESDVRNRRTTVYRLKNAPAADVAAALNEYLRNERQVEQIAPGLISAFEQIEREVVVVPEPVSNSLIVSATPRFYEEISQLVEELDERPPMVMIQVLIAQVDLRDTDEFGIELGLQDSMLFDRSVIAGTGGASVLNPGFNFNNQPLGNSGSAASLATRENLAGQSITNLGLGRTNSSLGFGGLVMSAASESVNILIRALQEQRRLEVLSRPQVMTMDNQTAQIVVGQEVPTVEATQLSDFGVVNSINYREVGLILTVTPRISPDQLVVMEIEAVKSEVGPIDEGIPIAVTEGEVVRAPRIDLTTTRTVVSAMDGQTVVLGGLITKSRNNVNRSVPYLADVPVLGHLFQYEFESEERSELLIIMTPRIVDSMDDAETIRRVESARMHWCLCDVMALHDGDGLSKHGPAWYDGNAAVIYPDLDPTLKTMQQLAPPGATVEPQGMPEVIPTPPALTLPENEPVPPSPPSPPSADPRLLPAPPAPADPAQGGPQLPPATPPATAPQSWLPQAQPAQPVAYTTALPSGSPAVPPQGMVRAADWQQTPAVQAPAAYPPQWPR